MSGRYLDRPIKLLATREITGGNVTVSAGASFVDVSGGALQMNVTKDSIVEVCVQFSYNAAGAGELYLDLEVDGTRQGQDKGLVQRVTSASDDSVFMRRWLTSLTEGNHTLALQARAVTEDVTIFAATTETPLTIDVIEHASVYPPS